MEDIMLIIDDIEMNRAILKVLFDKKYEIIEAETGEEALTILQGFQGSIDIVLLDLMLPGMSGFDVLKHKNEDYFKSVPVVVITSSGQLEDQVQAFDLGANDFISKPFVPEIVMSRVNNVMASNRRMLSVELEAQRMKVKSELDEMTSLYNKSTTENLMDGILRASDSHLEAMMVIDIDNFKTVNDTSGHQAGDHVIKIVANLISSLFRKTDVVGRIGGDEFCVLMVDVPSMEIVHSKVNELIQIMRYKPNLTIPEYVTLSIGLATNEKKNTTYPNLFMRADEALYKVKQSGKAQYREYGVEPVAVDNDNRSVVLLLSDNRNVCSAVHAVLPAYLRIVEVLQLKDLKQISDKIKEKVCIIYADVTDQADEGKEVWDYLKQIQWIHMNNVFAICEEGNIPQYLTALQSGIADMFLSPIDHDAFLRRTMNYLNKQEIVDMKENIR